MNRLKIGLLCGHRSTGYSRQLSLGVENAVVEQGHTYIKIAEQVPYHVKGNNYEYFKVAFEIAKSLDLDAYIVPASTVFQLMITQYEGRVQVDREELAAKSIALIKSLDPEKTLILEQNYEGFRCITKDNRPGMHECMRHLIEDHGYKRIAFISGPKTSGGAREREGVYFEEMEAHGLETPNELFIRGTFSGRCRDEVEKILDTNPEAVVCACDQIAFTAYRAAQDRGLLVGVDIAITGFDDVEEATQVDPPLSTVHLTSYDMGYMAGYEVVRLALGMPQKYRIQGGDFINRGSCGEKVMSITEKFAELIRNDPIDRQKVVDEVISASYSNAQGRMREYFDEKITKLFVSAFNSYQEHIKKPDKKIYMFSNNAVMDVILDPITQPYFNLAGFQNAMNAFMHAMGDEIPEEHKAWALEQATHLHVRISRLLQSEINNRLLEINDMEMHTLQIVDDALSTGDDWELTYTYMLKELAGAGIKYAKLCMYENPIVYVDRDDLVIPDKVNIAGSLINDSIAIDTDTSEPKATKELLSLFEKEDKLPQVITISGLIANNEISGFTVIDGGAINYEHQVPIFLMLGFAVKHLQMIAYQQEMVRLLNENNIMLTHQSQQDELTGLLNRRGFLLTTDIIIKNSIGKSAAVFFLDLDGLKLINDTHGHDIGDEAIKNTAEILTSCFRTSDLLGRQGGDEFVAFSLLAKVEDVSIISQRVEERMKAFNEEHDLLYTLSISIGYKTFVIDENSASSLDKYMGEADEMLYEVKRKKKGSRRFEAEKERK